MVFKGTTGMYERINLWFQFPINKNETEMCEFEAHLKNIFVCALDLHVSNDDIISFLRPGLKTGMDFRGLVRKWMWKMTSFGLT